jgi:hypothetical protein
LASGKQGIDRMDGNCRSSGWVGGRGWALCYVDGAVRRGGASVALWRRFWGCVLYSWEGDLARRFSAF